MSIRSFVLTFLLSLSLVAGHSPAEAQKTNGGRLTPEPDSAGVPNTVAKYAQAIAFVGQSGAPITAKGFKSITRVSTGIFCLQLQAALELNNSRIAPLVAVEWNNSLGIALFAQWDSGNIGCPNANKRTISVRTYKGDTGAVGSALQPPVLSDQVAWVIIVP